MKKYLVLLFLLFLTGCSLNTPVSTVPETAPAESETAATEPSAPAQFSTEVPEAPTDPIADMVDCMTADEKVGQLFLARYDAANAAAHVRDYRLGGWILFGGDFDGQTPDSIRAEVDALQALSPVPLLMAVDEEGGTVTRVSRYPAFRDQKFPSPRSLYAAGGKDLLLTVETEKCALLTELGLNVNMAPVCDITTDRNAFMYSRSLGQDPETTGMLIAAMVETMTEHGVGSVLKHFPGYGNNDDTHVGIARDSRSLETLETADLIPFRAGIRAGCGAVLVSHTIVEALDDTLPASLSPNVISYLRNEMGFTGVIMTDDLVMEAITETYGAGEAAVLAVLAGCDLLCSTEYVTQYEAVLAAVQDGRIPMERIDEAVTHILRWKQELGLLAFED